MQKAPFIRSRGLFLLLIIGSAFCFLLTACHMNPNMQTQGQTWLQGEWQQDSVPAQQQLISYSLYHIKFDCDSFYVMIKTFSKANYSSDTCTSKGHWAEYAAGHYEQRHDTLFLKGEYTKPNFKLKVDVDCLHSGVYKEIFKIIKQTDSVVQLASTSGVIPLTARRIKRTTCTVKPL